MCNRAARHHVAAKRAHIVSAFQIKRRLRGRWPASRQCRTGKRKLFELSLESLVFCVTTIGIGVMGYAAMNNGGVQRPSISASREDCATEDCWFR